MLALAGCGQASSSSSSSGTGAGGGTGTAAATGTSGGTGTSGQTGTAGDAGTAADTTSTSSPAAAASARPAATSGYGTYELCQGTCRGAVPAALRRPLRLPADDGGPCPVTLQAPGEVDVTGGTELGVSRVAGSSWLEAHVTWSARGSYTGPLLIRGGELGGGARMGFGSGRVPYDELQLLDAGRGAPRVNGGGRAWLTVTRVPAAGCYAYQADGTSFTKVIVFRAVG